MLKTARRHKLLLSTLFIVFAALLASGIYQVQLLNKAHSTFANYYKFRGCTQLIKKAPAYGVCKTESGQVITIVLYHGKWYLQGDLPAGLLGHLL